MVTRPLGHHLHPAVVEVQGEAGEAADLQSVCPGEPAEAHSLYPSAHPGGHPYIVTHGCTLAGELLEGHVAAAFHGVQSHGMRLTRTGAHRSAVRTERHAQRNSMPKAKAAKIQ
ncbi:hypothetical protein GCM10010282_42050 [Streptomyces roseolus]|nr:hypothetical protein GCM10010282_42050 [Streptomyces roseolus]